MTRIEAWDILRRFAGRIDRWLEPKPPYHRRVSTWTDRFVTADSRVRLAVYAAWLALRGDETFYQRWEARHIHGVERYVRDHAREKQRARLVAAAEVTGDRPLREELGAAILKNRKLAAEVRTAQEAAERRNRDLAALHIVWCDGGCAGGVGMPETLDRETVVAAVRNTTRLVRWWNNRRYKDVGYAETAEYLAARVAEKVPEVTP